jgi:hypothetical protein
MGFCSDDEYEHFLRLAPAVEREVQEWYAGLDPEQQQAVRDRVEVWMNERGVVPGAPGSPRETWCSTPLPSAGAH